MSDNKEHIDFGPVCYHATEGIIVSDEKGRIVEVNPSAERMFGYTSMELKGEKVEHLIPERFRTRHTLHRKHYAHDGLPRPMGIEMNLYALAKQNRELPVEISLCRFEHKNEVYIASFVIDVTARKLTDTRLRESEENLRKLNMQLEQKVSERTRDLEKANRDVLKALEKEKELSEFKSRFVSMASHEFRTPLTGILSSAALLQKYNEQNFDDKRAKHIQRIRSAVKNLTEILNDFLSLGKFEEGKTKPSFEEIDIEEQCSQIVEELQVVLKNDQNIEFKCTGQNKIVKTDPQLFKNILINLVSNAIKYSHSGTTIKVTCKIRESLFITEVVDAGIGIPENEQKNLFTRFFRAKNSGNIQGTGLGLNIVKNYVELLKGRVTFTSELDKGSTFRVSLPTR